MVSLHNSNHFGEGMVDTNTIPEKYILIMFTTLSGFVIRLCSYVLMKLMEMEFIPLQSSWIDCAQITLSILLFITLGIIVRKRFDEKKGLQAIEIVVGYAVAYRLLTRIAELNDFFSALLRLPIVMFNIPMLIGIHFISGASYMNMALGVLQVISTMMPLLFLLFIRKDQNKMSPGESP